MKTTFDAVNELRADLNNSEGYECGEESLYYSKNRGEICTYYGNTLNGNYVYHICTVIEFNALVEEMESNFGKCSSINVSDYKIVAKTPLEPIKQNLIYTQEMCDNGVLPSVGMEVVARYNHDSKTVTHEGKLKYLSDKNAILDIGGIEWHGIIGDYVIEPITPEVTLIDGEAYQFEARGKIFNGIYEKRAVSFNVL